MARRKISVQHEGQTIEVEVDGLVPESEVDAGYIPKAKVDQIVADAKKKATRSALTGALNDDDFKKQALTHWNIDPTKLGGSGGAVTDEQMAAIVRDVEAKKVKPLELLLEQAKTGTASLQRRVLQKSIVAAARAAGVKPEFLDVLPGGREPAIVTMVESAFGLHDEDGEFYVKKSGGGDGFEISPSKEAGRLFANVEDYFSGLAKDKTYARIFERQSQSVGSGTARNAQDTTPGEVANDPVSIGRNLEAIASGKAVVAGTGA